MARVRYSDLVLELVEVAREIRSDLQQRLRYYRASAYKLDAAQNINEKVDQLRAIFQILADDDLNEAMADHDAVLMMDPQMIPQMIPSGDCSMTARINILIAGMDPALAAMVRRFGQSQSLVREDTVKTLRRHRQTLMRVCREGSRSWELIRGF